MELLATRTGQAIDTVNECVEGLADRGVEAFKLASDLLNHDLLFVRKGHNDLKSQNVLAWATLVDGHALHGRCHVRGVIKEFLVAIQLLHDAVVEFLSQRNRAFDRNLHASLLRTTYQR